MAISGASACSTSNVIAAVAAAFLGARQTQARTQTQTEARIRWCPALVPIGSARSLAIVPCITAHEACNAPLSPHDARMSGRQC